jgi:hypothetical protein
MRVYLINSKTGTRYEVVELRTRAGDAREVVLKGPHGIEFAEPYTKKRMDKLGYVLSRQESSDE